MNEKKTTLEELQLEKENIERIIIRSREWLTRHNFTHPDWQQMNDSKFKLIEDLGSVIIDINQIKTKGYLGAI